MMGYEVMNDFGIDLFCQFLYDSEFLRYGGYWIDSILSIHCRL